MLQSHASIEEVQRYWDSRPCNIRHSPREIGTLEYFEEVEARKYFVEPHIPLFAQFEQWKDKKVLEIGCGIGTDTISFLRAGAHVTAVDVSERSLEIARQRAEIYGYDKDVTFVQADAERLSDSVPAQPYDLIYSFGVIHHTPNPENVLREIRKFVGPDSQVKIMVYNRFSFKVLWILIRFGQGRFYKLKELVARYSEAQTGCPITFTYGRRELGAMLERNGFRARRLDVQHIFPYRIPDYVDYRYVKVWYLRWMPPRLFRWLERRLGWHLCVTAEPA